MLFKIGDTIYDPNETPCAVIFANTKEKNIVAKNIKDISVNESAEFPEHWFSCHPKGYFTEETFDKWSVLTAEERDNMTVVTGKVEIKL